MSKKISISIDLILNDAWKKIKNKKNKDEIVTYLLTKGINGDSELLEILTSKLQWEFSKFKTAPKRSMIFVGIDNDKIYVMCKKCKLLMTNKYDHINTSIKNFLEAETIICPDCNNVFLYNFEIFRKNTIKHNILINNMNIKTGFARLKMMIKYRYLHCLVCIKELFKI